MRTALLVALAACFVTLLLAVERGAYAWEGDEDEDEVEEDDDDFDFVSSNVREAPAQCVNGSTLPHYQFVSCIAAGLRQKRRPG
jgi:hypothetical protein